MLDAVASQPSVGGSVVSGFELVADEFARNFEHRGEKGAACAVFHRGEKVVDLWGGYRNQQRRSPWTEDTLVLSFSVTKGMSAAAMAVAHSRGHFQLDRPVADYWPEFAASGKQHITVRQLLAHQAGLVSIDRKLDVTTLADHDLMSQITACQRPLWQPGTQHGYHTLTLGWYQNELIRRTDPQGRSLGQFFQEEIAEPLGIEYYIGLPPEMPSERVSQTTGFRRVALLANLHQVPWRMVAAGIWPRSVVARSVGFLNLSDPAILGNADFRHVEIPSANGIGQARAVARVYDVLSRGGKEIGLTDQTYQELVAPASVPAGGTRDAILKIDTRYGLGFSRPSIGFSFGVDRHAFGCPGAGGSFGMADPTAGLSFAYLTNTMSVRIFDDAREKAIRDACYRCIAARPGVRVAA